MNKRTEHTTNAAPALRWCREGHHLHAREDVVKLQCSKVGLLLSMVSFSGIFSDDAFGAAAESIGMGEARHAAESPEE